MMIPARPKRMTSMQAPIMWSRQHRLAVLAIMAQLVTPVRLELGTNAKNERRRRRIRRSGRAIETTQKRSFAQSCCLP
eukprot:3062401-Pleurochrysis_carterae.AAC.1